jgi:hypothetical protein
MNAPTIVATPIATSHESKRFNLTPQTIDDALRFAELLCKSSIVPKDYQGNAGNVLVAMQWGMELGLQPLQAMQSIAVINGRPSIWGDAMIALVRASGLMEAMREDIGDEQCTCHVKRRGEPEQSRTFTVDDAKKAGLWNKQGPWQTAPKRMLQMRARAFALRDIFPDVLRGMYVGEEAQDLPREKDVTAEGETIKADPPKSRTESLKAKLADKRGATLDQVLAGIAAAMDEDALAAAGKLAAKLQDVADKDAARNAYKARKAALDHVDTDTGEIAPQAQQTAPSVTYAQVRDALERAQTDDERALAADMIRLVADEAQRAELTDLFRSKAD